LLIAFLVLTLVLSAGLAYHALDAARSHRATAENTLRDYAGIAAWEFARRSRDILSNALWMSLGQVDQFAARRGLPPPDVLADAEPQVCDCPGIMSMRFFFRFDLPDGKLLVAPDTVPVEDLAWLTDTLSTHLRKLQGRRAGFMPLPASARGVRSGLIAFQAVGERFGLPRAAYGFVADFEAFDELFSEWCGRKALLPPAIAGDQPNDSLLHILVSTPGDLTMYESPVRYPTTFAAQDTIGSSYAGLAVRAAIRPEAAGQLVIGGLPRSRLPLVLGLLLLSMGMGVAALVQLRREAELARLRDDFVSGVSHELRTPLAQIRMFAELLDQGKLRSDEERRRSTKVINREARRLSHLVETVLHFSRQRRDTTRLVLEPVDVTELLGEVEESFAPLANSRGVGLQVRIEEDLLVQADRGALSQMLLNLLDNAVKYGPAGQIAYITVWRVGDALRMAIDDEGSGIPVRDRERIFEPYRRLDRDGNGNVAGSGIGLAVVRGLAELHDGGAWVEDAPSGGARFVIELPRAQAKSSKPVGEKSQSPQGVPA
jgi:signal transduction histidine kinase